MRIHHLLSELRRRRVFRALAWYGAAAFALLQGLAFVAPQFDWPAWIVKAGVITALVGVPAVALLAWALSEGAATAPRTRSDSLPPWLAPSPWLALAAGLLLVVGGHQAWTEVSRPTAAEPVTIAVLPLANLSGRPEDEGFVNGLHDTLIDELGRNPNLRVMLRDAVLPYAGTMVDPARIKDELGAQYLLEGGVQRDGDRLNAQVRLTDARSGRRVWSHVYERAVGETFVMQRELSEAVVAALEIAAAPADHLTKVESVDPKVVDLYLKGVELAERSGPGREARRKEALAIFEQVVQQAPGFAPGWARIAMTHAYMMGDPKRLIDKRYAIHAPLARAALARAIALDSALIEAEDAAFHLARLDYDRVAAERHTRRLTDLSPAGAIHHSEALMDLARWDESIEVISRYIEIAPREGTGHLLLGNRLMGVRRYADAQRAYAAAVDLGNRDAYSDIAYARLCATGDWTEFGKTMRANAGDAMERGWWTFHLREDDGQEFLAAARAHYQRLVAEKGTDLGLLEDLEPYFAALDITGNHAEAKRIRDSTTETFSIDDPSSMPPRNLPWLYLNAAAFDRVTGRDESVRPMIDKAAALIDPEDRGNWAVNNRIHVGLAYGEIGEHELATRWLAAGFAGQTMFGWSCPWKIWHDRFNEPLRAYAPYRELMSRHGVDVERKGGT